MRPRHTVAALLGALALTVTLPTSASATGGAFHYKFVEDGTVRYATLHHPASPACITLPEVADDDTSKPAFAPYNDTDATAIVFEDADCGGDHWTLKPHGKPATDRLKLRSVYLYDRV
ncbi:hypothetical protein AB0H82_14195 [Streptomyces sp. NPDC050732]|uniref:hypothetical protein n=1 Tax=Streptomyces sp. NPDC050732 TaxID=3154632 RepID=UPI00341A23ED